MTFSINEFKSNGLVFGGARPAMFEITLPQWPGALPDASRKLSFLAKAASLPPSILDPIEIPYMGRRIKVVGDRSFPAWSITVMNDEDFLLRESFEQWHQLLNQREQNVSAIGTEPANYKKDIIVTQLSKGGGDRPISTSSASVQPASGSIYTYTLVGAFPTVVDPIQLDFEAVNQVEQFNVEFQYDYWEPREIREGVSPE
jgi:hypothetical protein